MKNTIFVSYTFDDKTAVSFREIVGDIAHQLRRLSIADGKSLIYVADFSNRVAEFIKDEADCLIGIFTAGKHGNSNVLYEVGVAVGASKKTILIADARKRVPSMLQQNDIITPDTGTLTWLKDFQEALEKRLRFYFQLPDDHFLENKLNRRYSAEERKHLKNPSRVELPIDIIRSGDFWKAVAVLRGYLADDDKNLDAIFLLSEAHYLLGFSDKDPTERDAHFREQLKLTERGLSLEPDHILFLNARAIALMRLGEFDRADKDLKRLLQLEEGFSVGQYAAACLAALNRDKALMLSHFKNAVRMNPDWKNFAKEDPDFMAFFEDAEWQEVVYSRD